MLQRRHFFEDFCTKNDFNLYTSSFDSADVSINNSCVECNNINRYIECIKSLSISEYE